MDDKLLPKKFFKDNPLADISAPLLTYFSMKLEAQKLLQDKVWAGLQKVIPAQRVEEVGDEEEEISRLENGEAVVAFMRHGYDVANRGELCRKALSIQDEVFPLMLRRFRTSFQSEFVEISAQALSQGKQIYIDQLKAMYPEIRNPYAQSMACLVFGVQRQEDTLPLLLSEYERMKSEYPGEGLCQGPLLAIYILYDKA